jgi:osmotically-inducible protein OsmY
LAFFGVLATLTLTSAWTPAGQQNRDESQAAPPVISPDRSAAQQPSQADQDRELARKLRRALLTTKSLSTYAHNVNITARNGVVTLKGPVRSEKEKSAIVAKAIEIAGASNVKDEMTMQPPT